MAKGKIISSTFWILKLIYVPISLSKKKTETESIPKSNVGFI